MDFASVCTVCLRQNSELLDIFEKSGNMSYLEIIKSISLLELQNHFLMSKHICMKCRDTCDEFVKFRNLISTSYEQQLKVSKPEIKIEPHEEVKLPLVKVELIEDEEFFDPESATVSSDECSGWVDKEATFRVNKRLIRTKESDQHVDTYTPKTRTYPCKTCNRKFLSEVLLTRHENIHSDLVVQIKSIKKHWCIYCNTSFKNRTELMEHTQKHQLEIITEPIKCLYCSKSYSTLRNLKRHLDIHDENKTHVCKLCNKKFALGETLIDHLVRHKGYKPYTCDICNKSYIHIAKIRDHMKSHSDKKVRIIRFYLPYRTILIQYF